MFLIKKYIKNSVFKIITCKFIFKDLKNSVLKNCILNILKYKLSLS